MGSVIIRAIGVTRRCFPIQVRWGSFVPQNNLRAQAPGGSSDTSGGENPPAFTRLITQRHQNFMGSFAAIKTAASAKSDRDAVPQLAIVEPAAPPAPGSTAPGRRVLFVDADPAALQRFERELEAVRARWEFSFAASGTVALQLLAEHNAFDAVIADLPMPGMSGLDLLNEVAKQHPQTKRFIRCDAADRPHLKCSTGPAPHTMPREADAGQIEDALARAFLLDAWMADAGLKNLVARIRRLPSLPVLYTQVLEELQKTDGSIEVIAQAIAKDPVMTAKILQVVNSPYFALAYEVNSPVEAVLFLGTERTKSVILLAKVFSQFDQTKCAGFSLETTWLHSMAVSSFARIIALDYMKETKQGDLAFTAGLLHDVGKLFLAANLPAEYSQIIAQAARRQLPVRDVEHEALGATHAELGACQLGLWGLPLPILQAIAWHHEPRNSGEKTFSVLTAVHIANAFDYERKGVNAGKEDTQLAEYYLQTLGVAQRLNRWRELCGIGTKCNGRIVAEKT